MALLQSLPDSAFLTFSGLAECILKKILSLLKKQEIKCVIIIFDRYDNPQSIKILERQRRGASDGPTHVITGNANTTNYRRHLRSSGKTALRIFVTSYIISAGPQRIQSDGLRSIDQQPINKGKQTKTCHTRQTRLPDTGRLGHCGTRNRSTEEPEGLKYWRKPEITKCMEQKGPASTSFAATNDASSATGPDAAECGATTHIDSSEEDEGGKGCYCGTTVSGWNCKQPCPEAVAQKYVFTPRQHCS
ncbi:hypothetical protein JOB18_008240 [Solea senegalensis]|uniref:Uncharacterized protein n=1 Tax=Solea senegalensis TaxID=28829 RepID=A0AAV6QGU7_SOLSE|nr:hypothetical protein JOB18_008240 [Solea senegalensis]